MPTPESEQLADTFATIACELEAATGLEEIEGSITRFAIEHVPGCAYAAISRLRRKGGVTTVAATDDVAGRITALQHQLREGPGLAALTHHVPVAVDDLHHERRWPGFARHATSETHIASALAFPLSTSEHTTGALNLYADKPDAFDHHSRTIGTILAAHAAIALACAQEHQRAENLELALENSRTIGTAIGIIMCTQQLTRHQAFNFLVEASQRLNTKLHTLADIVVDTGGIPDRFDDPHT